MRLLHTADWHLGQNLMYRERTAEHELALDWLLDQLLEQEVDGLILAGDVFDISSPPNYARRMYYRFLKRLLNTPCRHVLIVGGNHDSPSMLEAPGDLLEVLNIVVVGAVPERPERAIVEWRDPEADLEAVVAAVPFLRDRDLKTASAGESSDERIRRIQEGILNHYQEVAERLHPYLDRGIPLLTTGHLYAKGAVASDKQDNIYIGNLENIDAHKFPSLFDYVALGHLHRPQAVDGQPHIRYSGSLIPLSFSETKDDKGAYLVEFEGADLKEVRFLAAPVFRRLKTIRDQPDNIRERLRAFAQRPHGPLTPWVEVVLPGHHAPPGFDNTLRDFVREEKLDLDLLKISFERLEERPESWQEEEADLQTLSDLEVFEQRCQEAGVTDEEQKELKTTYRELLAWMAEQAD